MPRGDTYPALHPAPTRSWWLDAQADYATFAAALAAELPRMRSSKEAQHELKANFIIGPPERTT